MFNPVLGEYLLDELNSINKIIDEQENLKVANSLIAMAMLDIYQASNDNSREFEQAEILTGD